MKRKKRIINKKQQKKQNELYSFIFFSLGALLLISLISFTPEKVSSNWLGIVGYSIGWFFMYLFGLGSYLFIVLLTLLGISSVSTEKNTFSNWKMFCFSLLLVSTCILLSVFSYMYPSKAVSFNTNIFSEQIFDPTSIPRTFNRYYLGGYPFYYVFKDLPYINLHNLLSNSGNILIFSISAFLGLLFLTETHLFSFLKKTSIILYKIIKSVFSFSNKSITRINAYLKEKKKKKALKPPSYQMPKVEKKKKLDLTINKFLSKEEKKPINIKTKPDFLKNIPIPTAMKPKKNSSYLLPSFSLLSNPQQIDHPSLIKDLKKQAEILEETLKSFGIEAKVGEIHCGPTITLFEVHPAIGVKVQKIKALERDIALNLEAKAIRIIAPIPGKAAVGVEIPSLYPQEVSLKEMLFYYTEQKKKMLIPMLLGKTVTGEHVITDLAKMPHCLIAGATGSGKSVCINTIVMSILMNSHPDEVKFLMIDPKKVELTQYSRLPHMLAPVITEAHGAYAALQWLVKEMQSRYDILKHLGLRNITAFNNRKNKNNSDDDFHIPIPENMPLIVAIVDEFADLMMVSSSDLETPIARIAQMARAVGIHLILATQRPSREVITGIIKANFPSRIAFKVASRINSQIILDETGAESLLGNGDLLFLPPGSSHLIRAQGAYIKDEDINRIIADICEKNPPSYLIPSFDALKKLDSSESNAKDALYEQALDIVVSTKNASTTFLQRKLKIGYARAASLMDELEENGIIGPQIGSKPRQILVSDD